MNNRVQHIVILGGGSAGWLTAGLLASEYANQGDNSLTITLIESSTLPPIGVGEGTWPSMRSTLERIGISETEFILKCDASFKQGSRFNGWLNGQNEHYYHPFTFPVGMEQMDLAPYWLPHKQQISFADAVTPQAHLCNRQLAPKQISTAEYAFNANYGYHLDAGKFGQLLRDHCINKLGIKHLIAHVEAVINDQHQNIQALQTKEAGLISGDLFVDCSGLQGRLIEQHYQIPLISQQQVLFNNSALAIQVPYADEQAPIASHTLSTAQQAGWIWDIALPTRRGVGYTYSSEHTNDEQAAMRLREYIAPAIGKQAADSAELRKIAFNPGYRQKFWHKNCVAIGMAAGFLEPLEASALVMVELSAQMLCAQLPKTRDAIPLVAKRFNHKFEQRWQQVIEFLKLHYVLSQRTDSAYWLDNRASQSIPEGLQELMQLWQSQLPSRFDITQTDALFPSASYQYVLYGMGYHPQTAAIRTRHDKSAQADVLFNQNMQTSKQLLAALPSNRELINKIKQYGLPKI